MKALSRKCTAFLLSLTLLLTLAPTALASEALGDDLDLRSTTLNRGAELGEGTFWSNTFSDLRQENYVVYTPNTSVTPIVTYGDYTTATSTVSAAAKRLEEQGLRVVAGINGDYYDTLNGAPLGTVMTDGVLRVASASNYAVGFRADGTAILGAPALAMQVESANTSFSIAAVNQVRYSYGGIYLYTYDFNARRSTGTNAAGYDVVCSAVDGRLSIGGALTLTVDEILPEATDTAVPEGKYVLTANLLSGEEYYEEYQQLDNGVGMLRSTMNEFLSGLEDVESGDVASFTVATGKAAEPFIARLVAEAKKKFPQLRGEVVGIVNDFFGHTITVSGLVTAQDLITQLKDRPTLGERVLIPANMLRHGEGVFLDDYTVEQVEQALGRRLTISETDGYSLCDAIFRQEP